MSNEPRRKRTAARSGRVAERYAHYDPTSPMRPDVGTQPQFRKKKPPATYRYVELRQLPDGKYEVALAKLNLSDPATMAASHMEAAEVVIDDGGNELLVVKSLRDASA